MALGLFDETLRVEGWFDETAIIGGWFDESLIQQASGGPATITGTLAATDGSDIAASMGDVAHVGALAATDSADIAAFAGDVAHVGTFAATDAADTAAFSGAIAHVGTLVATDGADTFVADGTVTEDVISSSPPFIGRGGGGYLVELDAKPKRETITLYDEEAEILELLAAIMPVIQAQQQRRSTI